MNEWYYNSEWRKFGSTVDAAAVEFLSEGVDQEQNVDEDERDTDASVQTESSGAEGDQGQEEDEE